MLGVGEWIQVTVQGGFLATATAPSGEARILVAQYMVGENYTNPFKFQGVGDPSLGIVPPLEQFRKSYDFLTPDTYTSSYVTVVGKQGTAFKVDDMDQNIGFNQPIGTTDYGYVFVPLMPGAHHVSADDPIGITVSGLADFTSYLFAGGLNLFELNPG
jgi:hypothetical protein